jgi:hypothetical protein
MLSFCLYCKAYKPFIFKTLNYKSNMEFWEELITPSFVLQTYSDFYLLMLTLDYA